MSASFFVPLRARPQSISEVQDLIEPFFYKFQQRAPEVEIEKTRQGILRFEESDIYISQGGSAKFCRFSVLETDEENVDYEGLTMLANISTRGHEGFAGIVALAFAENNESIIWNDSALLDGRTIYKPNELAEILPQYI